MDPCAEWYKTWVQYVWDGTEPAEAFRVMGAFGRFEEIQRRELLKEFCADLAMNFEVLFVGQDFPYHH